MGHPKSLRKEWNAQNSWTRKTNITSLGASKHPWEKGSRGLGQNPNSLKKYEFGSSPDWCRGYFPIFLDSVLKMSLSAFTLSSWRRGLWWKYFGASQAGMEGPPPFSPISQALSPTGRPIIPWGGDSRFFGGSWENHLYISPFSLVSAAYSNHHQLDLACQRATPSPRSSQHHRCLL